MKKILSLIVITILALQANAQVANKDSKPLWGVNGKVENVQTVNKSGRKGDRFGKTATLSTADLEKMFWADPQVQALTKAESNTGNNNASPEKKVKPFWEVGASVVVLMLDPTSGTYVSTDSAGNKTNWLAVRYRGVDEKTKKPITLCMLKNVDKNLTTVWAEDGINNYSANATGSKNEIRSVKLGTKSTISFSQLTVADKDCRDVYCYRCNGVGCLPYVAETNNQTQY